jgi:ABC-2 type transport system permease protein
MNWNSVRAILRFELNRARRTWLQSIAAPVIATALYFVVFGSAAGSPLKVVDGVSYGSFIVPGLTLLTVLTQSVSNAAFGIYMPRYSGAIYEMLSARLTPSEMILGYVGAATLKSLILGLLVLVTARLFIPYQIVSPFWSLAILVISAITFSLIGFITGLCVDGWDRLQIMPSLVITPLIFLGGCFYSLSALPSLWRTLSFLNPLAYVIDLFRWSFFGTSFHSFALDFTFLMVLSLFSLGMVGIILRTGYRLQL